MNFRRLKTIITLATFGLLLSTNTAYAQHGQYVGGDISDLSLYEEHNSGYLDGNGNKINDLITWLKNECGWNTFRVRLFVNPSKKDNDGSINMSVCQDVDYVKALGKRIKEAGCNFVLDFHYADTWVDATHIHGPSVCNSMTVDQKAEWIYTYTKESLVALKEAGATPDFVQVGNEIMYGFMGITVAPEDRSGTDWDGYLKVLKQGCQAVRDNCPAAKIIIHTDRPTNASYNSYYYGKLDAAGIQYDIIGLSYYPFWHGYLSGLKSTLSSLKTSFPSKKVQIVETAYNFQYWPTSGINYDTRSTWACSADGQYNFIKDLITGLKDYENVDGLYYWFPEEAGCGDATNWDNQKYGNVITTWLNRGLWWEDKTTSGHWPVKASEGMVHYLFKDFLDPTITSVSNVNANANVNKKKVYTISGQYVGDDIYKISAPGLYISRGRKIIVH